MSNPNGRPLKYKSPEEMQERINWYFEAIKAKRTDEYTLPEKLADNKDFINFLNNLADNYPTVTGLALALGFTTRDSLINYENRSDEFFDTIKRAKLRVENAIEQRLFEANATGSIFNLKNNFGWKDKQETETTGQVTYNHNVDIKSKVLGKLTDEQLRSIIEDNEG